MLVQYGTGEFAGREGACPLPLEKLAQIYAEGADQNLKRQAVSDLCYLCKSVANSLLSGGQDPLPDLQIILIEVPLPYCAAFGSQLAFFLFSYIQDVAYGRDYDEVDHGQQLNIDGWNFSVAELSGTN